MKKMISNTTIFIVFCFWNVSCVQVLVSLDSFEFSFLKRSKEGLATTTFGPLSFSFSSCYW